MFIDLPQKTNHYIDPWWATFEEKFACLSQGKRRLAYFYQKPDSSTFRYRVYNMIESINAACGEFSASYFTADELPAMERVLKSADTLILCRVGYTDAINQLIMQARAADCKVFYDIDDLIFDLDQANMIMETLSERLSEKTLNTYYAYIARLGAVLKLCDAAIVTNQYLAERMKEFIDLDVHVLPNFLNDAQLQLSKELFRQKQKSDFARDQTLHIGYFSGSPTHNKDFQLAVPALTKIMDRDPRVSLRLGGYLDTPELQNYSSRIERFPMMDFMNLQIMQASTEINLVPLQNNRFTNCKSDLKYFEAGIVGTISVASPTFAYKSSIIDGVNGFLSDENSWLQKVESAIACVDSGYAEMATKAFDDCQRRYSKEAQQVGIFSVFKN